ncbi:MAG: tRNA lysidine(34) synthetase TilS [Hydrogenoanaerobacterium sp.]
MNKKVFAAVGEYNMIQNGDVIIAAVSGGADSTALLHFLHSNAKIFGITLRAAHINHGIRGAEGDSDEMFVRELCKKLSVQLTVHSIKDIFVKAKAAGQGLEEYARNERYSFFDELTSGNSAKIATAHTQSDSMETTLFNMARGTGLHGIIGVPPVRGRIIRPFIFCTRQDIEDYCKENMLEYVTDSTNLLDDCARNRIRHHIIPEMRNVHPGYDVAYARMTRNLRCDDELLEGLAQEALQNAKTDRGYVTASLLSLHKAVLYRVLAQLFRQSSFNYDARKAELLQLHLADKSFTLQLNVDTMAVVKSGVLNIIRTEAAVPYFELPVKEGRFLLNGSKTVVFTITNYEHSEQSEKYSQKGLNNVLDYDRINSGFVLRQKKDGDKIKLCGRAVTKSLKKLFYEVGFTPQQRQTVPVLADDSGVLWVYGFGCAQSVAVTQETKHILTISIEEEQK